MPAVALLVAATAAVSGLPADAATGVKLSGTTNAAGNPLPATYTPSIATTSQDGSTEFIRNLAPCADGNIYAVGLFSLIAQGGTTYTRNNAFSFSATTGAMTAFNPNVNGKVDAIALSPDCSTAYLGGSFTSVNGVAATNIAAVNVATNTVVPTFAHAASAEVASLYLSGSHLIAGGFGTISGTANKYLASLNPTTGLDDGYVNLAVSGTYSFTMDNGQHSGANRTNIYNLVPDPTKTKLLATGTFTTVGGVARRQIFMLDLGATAVTVDPWYSNEFNQNCNWNEPFWLQSAAWSPDGKTIYTAETGYKPATDNHPTAPGNDPNTGVTTGAQTWRAPRRALRRRRRLPGLGDRRHPRPEPPLGQLHRLRLALLHHGRPGRRHALRRGHERWLNNPSQCDNNNLGTAVVSPGMGALNQTTGSVITTTANPLLGLYTRSRGLGADFEMVTPQGLWVASDNGTVGSPSDTCGNKPGHAGLCLLPVLSSGTITGVRR